MKYVKSLSGSNKWYIRAQARMNYVSKLHIQVQHTKAFYEGSPPYGTSFDIVTKDKQLYKWFSRKPYFKGLSYNEDSMTPYTEIFIRPTTKGLRVQIPASAPLNRTFGFSKEYKLEKHMKEVPWMVMKILRQGISIKEKKLKKKAKPKVYMGWQLHDATPHVLVLCRACCDKYNYLNNLQEKGFTNQFNEKQFFVQTKLPCYLCNKQLEWDEKNPYVPPMPLGYSVPKQVVKKPMDNKKYTPKKPDDKYFTPKQMMDDYLKAVWEKNTMAAQGAVAVPWEKLKMDWVNEAAEPEDKLTVLGQAVPPNWFKVWANDNDFHYLTPYQHMIEIIEWMAMELGKSFGYEINCGCSSCSKVEEYADSENLDYHLVRELWAYYRNYS